MDDLCLVGPGSEHGLVGYNLMQGEPNVVGPAGVYGHRTFSSQKVLPIIICPAKLDFADNSLDRWRDHLSGIGVNQSALPLYSLTLIVPACTNGLINSSRGWYSGGLSQLDDFSQRTTQSCTSEYKFCRL